MAPGALIAGRYRIEGPLGSGGFGTIVRATQLPLGREVAIKVMSSPLGDTERFIQEAQTAQRLEHPNTVRILDVGQLEGGSPFIVFELLRGESLAEFIARSGALPLWAALRITSQVLKSLMEAHSQGVVHRDIKPANIFVTAHPGEPVFVKVLDFGVAKQIVPRSVTQSDGAPAVNHAAWAAGPTSPALTRADQVVGTPLYMSPEQARAQPVGPPSDLYSVGLVLAEMSTGRPVLDPGMGAFNVGLLHANPEPLPLPTTLSGSPVEGIVKRATAKEIPLRYHTAKDMLTDVEDALALTSTSPLRVVPSARERDAVFAPTLVAPFTPRLVSTPPPRRSNRWTVGLAVGVVAITLGAGLLVMARASDDRAGAKGAAAEADDDDDNSPRFEPKPFRTLDPSTRELPDRPVEDMISTLRGEGYTVHQSVAPTKIEQMDQNLINLRKRPCGGAITYTVFKDADLQRTYVDTMRAEGFLVETDNRVLSVFLTSVERTAENKRNCSNPVLALLTKPKRR